MADDRRRRNHPRHNSLIAAAALVDPNVGRRPLPTPSSWADEAWQYLDSGWTPEVGYATRYLANALSRCRLTAAIPGIAGQEPEPSETGAAADLVAGLVGGVTGQSQLLAAAGPQLAIPGVGYLIGEPRDTTDVDGPAWRVVSVDELGVTSSRSGNLYTVREGEQLNDVRTLSPDAVAVRFWRPHPRRHWEPDSPMRSALGVLRELRLLSQEVASAATSRLAGRGVWVIPAEVSFPVPPAYADAVDPLMAMYADVVTAAISDPESPAAQSPIILRVPADKVGAFQHFTFDSPHAARSEGLRQEAIRRFATAVDLPAEVVLGLADSNHWSAWQIQDSAQKLHIEPTLEALCHSLTVGFLHPALAALGLPADHVVWYDTSELSVAPDRSGAANDVYDRGGLSLRSLRREAGFDEADAPTEEERQESLLLDLVKASPALFPTVAPMLGIAVGNGAGTDLPSGVSVQQSEPSDTAPAHVVGPPERPISPGDNWTATQEGLVAAGDGIVTRALEVAGRRIVNAARKHGTDLSGIAPDAVHLSVPEGNDDWLDGVLDGAWVRADLIAERYEVDAAAYRSALTAYTSHLVTDRVPHSYDRLALFLGAVTKA